MKLKIKHRNWNCTLTVEDNITLLGLKTSVQEANDVTVGSFELSLNKKDPLEGEEQTLKELGIISGDIIHVINQEQDVQPNSARTGAPRISGNLPESVATSVEYENHNIVSKNQTASSPASHDASISGPSYGTSPQAGPSQQIAINSMDMEADVQVDTKMVQKCLSEPMLCRECSNGQVTSVLSTVYSQCHCRSVQEAICVAVHVLMLETGFLTQKEDATSNDTRVTSLDMMPDDWRQRAPGCFLLRYTHPCCSDDGRFTLTCVPLGGLIMVHGNVKTGENKEDNCQEKINISDFASQCHSDPCVTYRNLPKLSRLLKDSIMMALLQKYRDLEELPPLLGLLALNHEIKLRIMSCLDVVSLLRASEVCQDLNNVSQDRYIWRRLYLTDFGNRNDNSFTQDWQKIYKTEYQRRKSHRKFLQESTRVMIPPSFIPPDPYAPFAPPPPFPDGPGIIGGDYDLNPNFPGVPPHPLMRRHRQPDQINPLIRPRFDPIGPLPNHNIQPGRRGGFRDFGGGHFS